jgi:hypothetical protein
MCLLFFQLYNNISISDLLTLKEIKMTSGTISIKRKSGNYDQLWYVNSDAYPDGLGKEILDNLKTADDTERASVIFKKAQCSSRLETELILEEETESIADILHQYNDYSYIFDEETAKWGFYEGKKNKLHDLEEELKKAQS